MSKRILICTDLDRTLLPNGNQPEPPGARAAFTRLVSRQEMSLAYVSGRHSELIEEAITEFQLPAPDWVIGDVGSTLYQVDKYEWRYRMDWERYISADWRGLTAKDLMPLFTESEVSQFFEIMNIREC